MDQKEREPSEFCEGACAKRRHVLIMGEWQPGVMDISSEDGSIVARIMRNKSGLIWRNTARCEYLALGSNCTPR